MRHKGVVIEKMMDVLQGRASQRGGNTGAAVHQHDEHSVMGSQYLSLDTCDVENDVP